MAGLLDVSQLGDVVAPIGTAVAVVATAAGVFHQVSVSYRRDLKENRDRLQRELQLTADPEGGIKLNLPEHPATGDEGSGQHAEQDQHRSSTHNSTIYNISFEAGAAEARRAEREEQRFAVLLADYYAHGLTQAQRSSLVSLVFSGFGCLMLFVGVGLAIWRSETTGDLYATMVTNVTGIVTGVVGVLFHRQARRALEHLEGQTRLLRQDMRSERGIRQAVQIVDVVEDPELKARLQAALVLQFTEASLPDVQVSLPQPRTEASPSPNGQQAGTSTTDLNL
ncbi:TRADD-N-associated membrane domain-containing protein [Streptomyces sp. DT195]|uniref:TRADD-N-associated membrane domain-containing protein n=1 Tax=Streptomyces sp. DT195 TaxID=3393419 RepID=UPI003CE9A01A